MVNTKNFVDVAALFDAHGVDYRHWQKNGRNLMYVQNADELLHRIRQSISGNSQTDLLAASQMQKTPLSFNPDDFTMPEEYEGGRLWIDLEDASVHSKNYMTEDIGIVERWLEDLIAEADLPEQQIITEHNSRTFTHNFSLTGTPDDIAQAKKLIKTNMSLFNQRLKEAQQKGTQSEILKIEIQRLLYLNLEDAQLFIENPDMEIIYKITDNLFRRIENKKER